MERGKALMRQSRSARGSEGLYSAFVTLYRRFRMSLTAIVGAASSFPALWAFLRLWYGSQLTVNVFIAAYIAGVGYLCAVASHPAFCAHTTGLLGKGPKDGRVPLWSFVVFWPYRECGSVHVCPQPLVHALRVAWHCMHSSNACSS